MVVHHPWDVPRRGLRGGPLGRHLRGRSRSVGHPGPGSSFTLTGPPASAAGMRKILLFLLGLALLPSPAAAWWEYGHHTVGEIAMREVRPETRAQIRRLLAQERLLDTPSCRVRTLAEAAYWPDCIRGLGDRFSYTAPWHYQNIHVCRAFDARANCPDGNCVTAQIARHARMLANRELPTRERLEALAFLAHFVGDLHMPLHAGDRADLGGNRVAVNYGVIGGRTNLHSAWDGYIAERGISQPPGDAAGLLAALGIEERQAMRQGTVADWAQQSWELSRDIAYRTLFGDPCPSESPPVPEQRPTITEELVRSYVPVIRTQISRGGLRLAELLDQALSGTLPPAIAERR